MLPGARQPRVVVHSLSKLLRRAASTRSSIGSERLQSLLIERLDGDDPKGMTLRIELMTSAMFHLLADQARRIDANAVGAHRQTAQFREGLIDALTGLVNPGTAGSPSDSDHNRRI